MLADAATVADGKLYIHGGQWDRIQAQTFPATHPSLAVALIIRVEYTDALKEHEISVHLEIDGEPTGPRAEGGFQTGHAPQTAPGAASFVPLALTFPGVQFTGPGRYEWVVTLDGEAKTRLPMEVSARKGFVPKVR